MSAARVSPRLGTRTRLLSAVLVASVLLTVSAASPAFAGGSWWHISTSATPANLPPGGVGRIVVSVGNLGYEDAQASPSQPLHIRDVLPVGLKVISASKEFSGYQNQLQGTTWNSGRALGASFPCTAEPAGQAEIVSCLATHPVFSYEALEVVIPVSVESLASPTLLSNEAKIEGGEGGLPSSSRTQQVRVDASPTKFGIEGETEGAAQHDGYELRPENEDGTRDTQAGSHPFQLTSSLSLNRISGTPTPTRLTPEILPALPRNLHFVLPPGLLGNINAVPRCSSIDFSTIREGNSNLCPEDTAIGVAHVTIDEPDIFPALQESVPVFNLEPGRGEPARFGFEIVKTPVVLTTAVRTGSDYAVEVSANNTTQFASLLSTEVTFWGVPGDRRHKPARGWECLSHAHFVHALEEFPHPCGETAAEKTPSPFLTLPTACASMPVSTVTGDSWTGDSLEGKYTFPSALTGCASLPFNPEFKVAPEVSTASTPTGLTVHAHVPQETTLAVNGVAESAVRATTLALPQGIQASPAAASGLLACGTGEFGFNGENEGQQTENDRFSPAAASCPNASKIGNVQIKTPLLAHELTGGVYLASQDTNPFTSPLVLYLFAEDPVSGVRVKLAGEVIINQSTGQLTSVFKGTPPVPFEDLSLNLFGGPRASQSTPPTCGTYTSTASLEPWSGGASASVSSQFAITSGANGGPCSAQMSFSPSLQAGSLSSQAGGFSSFSLTIAHPDSSQALQSLSVHLPSGLAAMLSSVTPCPIATADAGQCGEASLIGHSTTSSGLGGEPYSLGGQAYLTGPYDGAPFGISVLTPAEGVGPFHLGKIIANSTIQVDQYTAAVTVATIESRIINPAGATTVASTPLPTIIDGVPVQLKQINVTVDRPNFQFNPTNCAPMAVAGDLGGSLGASATVSSPFQVTNCTSLPFKPVLTATTQRAFSKAEGASLTIKVTSSHGQANIAKTRLVIPSILPSRLTTIQKACPDAAFSANPANCSAHYGGSLIGMAVVHTPVLKAPLMGPAYLVSHGNAAFPDVEFVLQGEGITLILDGQTNIHKGVTTSTFNAVPDAPVSSFEAILPRGPHSALTAYRPGHSNLCGTALVVPTTITGQNGVVIQQNTKVAVSGCAGVKSYKANNARLTKALKSCKKKKKSQRARCEAQARKRYGSGSARKRKK